MRRATEDEQPVHFLQPARLDLTERAGLPQPPKALLDQPAATQPDGVAGLPSGPSIQIAAAVLVVLRNMRRHVQLPHRAHEILAIVSLVGAHSDAPGAAVLFLFEHQQRRVALGIAIGIHPPLCTVIRFAVFAVFAVGRSGCRKRQ